MAQKRLLPREYIQLESIQGDGNSYIDTGLQPSLGDSFKFNACCTVSPDMSSRYAIFDSGIASGYKTCILMGTASESSGGASEYYKYFATGTAPSIRQSLTIPTNVEIESTGIIKYNGTQVATSDPVGDVDTNIFLWRHITSGTCSTAKFAGNFEWRDSNGNLRRNLFPAKRRSDNVLGMYDLVTNQFFTNAGTGTFIGGNPVETYDLVPVNKKSILFTNPALHDLPSGYTELEYVTSNKITSKTFDGTESFVTTGILTNCWSWTTSVDRDISFTDRTVLCTHFNTSSTLPAATARHGYALAGKVISPGSSQVGKYIGFGAVDDYASEEAFKQELENQYNEGHPITVIYAMSTASATPNKFYYMAGGTPYYAHTFVPAKNSSNVAGLYCLEAGNFITNVAEESFTAGPEVPKYLLVPVNKSAVLSNRLPAGYTELEHIKSDGNSYIKTGVSATNQSVQVQTTMKAQGGGDWGKALGYSASTAGYPFSLWAIYNGYGGYGTPSIVTTDVTQFNSVTMSSSSVTFPEFYIFDVNPAILGYGKLIGGVKTLTIKVGEATVRNMIPAQRKSDNVVGMYDLVTKRFFTNQGTGSFIAGPEAHTVCPIPTTTPMILRVYD